MFSPPILMRQKLAKGKKRTPPPNPVYMAGFSLAEEFGCSTHVLLENCNVCFLNPVAFVCFFAKYTESFFLEKANRGETLRLFLETAEIQSWPGTGWAEVPHFRQKSPWLPGWGPAQGRDLVLFPALALIRPQSCSEQQEERG